MIKAKSPCEGCEFWVLSFNAKQGTCMKFYEGKDRFCIPLNRHQATIKAQAETWYKAADFMELKRADYAKACCFNSAGVIDAMITILKRQLKEAGIERNA